MKNFVLLRQLLSFLVVLSISLIFPVKIHATERAEFHCQPKNKVVDRTGKLVVGDFAISRAVSPSDKRCPSGPLRWDKPIETRPGKDLYFWFRMNGGPDYLDAANGRELFKAYFYSIRSDGQIRPEKVVRLGEIVKWKAKREAQSFDGHFDWRLKGKRWGITVPGKYRLRVQQGNSIICFNKTISSHCSIDFEITR